MWFASRRATPALHGDPKWAGDHFPLVRSPLKADAGA